MADATKREQDIHPIDAHSERRNDHSATAWLVEPTLAQPQDGASPQDASEASASSLKIVQGLQEAKDAVLTGSTRSLVRRVMGLNFAFRAPQKIVTALAHVRPLNALQVVARRVRSGNAGNAGNANL